MSWGSAACDRNGRKGGWRSWQIPDHAQESGLDFKGKQGQFIRRALTGWDAAVGLEKVGTGRWEGEAEGVGRGWGAWVMVTAGGVLAQAGRAGWQFRGFGRINS